jgi:hypothetical protein
VAAQLAASHERLSFMSEFGDTTVNDDSGCIVCLTAITTTVTMMIIMMMML